MFKKILKYIKNRNKVRRFHKKCPDGPCSVCKYYMSQYNRCILMDKLGINKQLEKDDLDV